MLNNLLKFTKERYSQGQTAAKDLGDDSTYQAMANMAGIILGGSPTPKKRELPSEEDINKTMLDMNMTREQVLKALGY